MVLKTQSRFERDEFAPNSEYLLALEALGIDAAYILTGRPSAAPGEESALLSHYRTASIEAKALALQFLGVTAVAAPKAATSKVKTKRIGQIIEGNVTMGDLVMGKKTSKQ